MRRMECDVNCPLNALFGHSLRHHFGGYQSRAHVNFRASPYPGRIWRSDPSPWTVSHPENPPLGRGRSLSALAVLASRPRRDYLANSARSSNVPFLRLSDFRYFRGCRWPGKGRYKSSRRRACFGRAVRPTWANHETAWGPIGEQPLELYAMVAVLGKGAASSSDRRGPSAGSYRLPHRGCKGDPDLWPALATFGGRRTSPEPSSEISSR